MRDDIEKLPVYQKAKELLHLAEHIADYLKDNEQRDDLRNQIISNAMLIVVKIAGTQHSDLYSTKIENALRIKFAVREMFDAILFARLIEINNNDYVQLMRNGIEEFRVEFVKWIRTFDTSYDYKDDWGIRYSVDQSNDFEIKMVQIDSRDLDSDDFDMDWDFDNED